MSELTEWASGIPPQQGWWNASIERDPSARRYWNGETWSAPCYVGDPDDIAERARMAPSQAAEVIEWRGLTRPSADVKDSNPKDAIGVMKAKLSVVPSGVLYDLGLAMLEGACKYGRHNYRAAGVRASVYYDAACGHIMDWWEGQDLDPESDLSHVTKAIASLVVLRDAMMQDMLTDDRPPRSKVTKADFNAKARAIIERYACDTRPRHFTIEDSRA